MGLIVSIDPGKQTGICEIEDGKIRSLDTHTPLLAIKLLDFALTAYRRKPDMVVIEDSRLQSFIFQPNAAKGNKAFAMSISRDIGCVDGLCALFEDVCLLRGCLFVSVSPKDKGAKLDAEAFRRLTGWEGRTNAHERDAAAIGWRYRHYSPPKKRVVAE